MKQYAILGRVFADYGLYEKGAVVVEGEEIIAVGNCDDLNLPTEQIDVGDRLVLPGFVDIHCHGYPGGRCHTSAEIFADYHLKHGTTGLLGSLYRTLPHKETMDAIKMIGDAMGKHSNLLGVHMEGPYINPDLGSNSQERMRPVRKEEYTELFETGLIKQMTVAPEMEGTAELFPAMAKYGIVPALGHSAASPEDIKRAVSNGASIITHLFDATGCSIEPTRCGGTKEVNFDQAAMLCDHLFYELIVDSQGIHVRHDTVRFAAKAVGVDRLVAITDRTQGYDDEQGSDLHFVDGELNGSMLTMDRVCKNLKKIGFSLHDIVRMTSENPARAIRVFDKMGSLTPGKLANMVIADEDFNLYDVYCHGEKVTL